MGQSDLGGGAVVVVCVAYGLGVELRSAEGLGVVRTSMTLERDYIDSRSVLILSTSAWNTSGSPSRKQLERALNRERSAFVDLDLVLLHRRGGLSHSPIF